MADEIEEFIRRAAERRKQQALKKPQQPKPAPAPQPQRPQRAPLAAPISRPSVVEAEVVPAEVAEHVSSHVATHLDTREFLERATHLGEQTALADDRLEARLHQKFDHALGRLAKGSSISQVEDIPDPGAAAPAATSMSPAVMAQLLRSPQQIRSAIIMSEILNRPEHLW